MIIGAVDNSFQQKLLMFHLKQKRKNPPSLFLSKHNQSCSSLCIPNTSPGSLFFENLVEECDRHSISDLSAASLANALLKDLEQISENNRTLIIDRNKIKLKNWKETS